MDTGYGGTVGCLLSSELPADAAAEAPVEQPLTQLFFLGDRDGQAPRPAGCGRQTPPLYPAANLDHGPIDRKVLKQRWGA